MAAARRASLLGSRTRSAGLRFARFVTLWQLHSQHVPCERGVKVSFLLHAATVDAVDAVAQGGPSDCNPGHQRCRCRCRHHPAWPSGAPPPATSASSTGPAPDPPAPAPLHPAPPAPSPPAPPQPAAAPPAPARPRLGRPVGIVRMCIQQQHQVPHKPHETRGAQPAWATAYFMLIQKVNQSGPLGGSKPGHFQVSNSH